jgi:hypothetical protein
MRCPGRWKAQTRVIDVACIPARDCTKGFRRRHRRRAEEPPLPVHNREINREFFNFGPSAAIFTPNRLASSMA